MQIKNAIVGKLLSSAMSLLASTAWAIVKAAVESYDAASLSGEDKKKAVLEAVEKAFREQELVISKSITNLLIEAGVVLLRLGGGDVSQ